MQIWISAYEDLLVITNCMYSSIRVHVHVHVSTRLIICNPYMCMYTTLRTCFIFYNYMHTYRCMYMCAGHQHVKVFVHVHLQCIMTVQDCEKTWLLWWPNSPLLYWGPLFAPTKYILSRTSIYYSLEQIWCMFNKFVQMEYMLRV